MSKTKDIPTLYWANIRKFWQSSFRWGGNDFKAVYDMSRTEVPFLYNSRETLSKKTHKTLEDRILIHLLNKYSPPEFESEVGPFPIWMIELVFFIPNIIVFPLIRTIVDFYTRKPLDIDIRNKIITDLARMLDTPEEFDAFVLGMCDELSLYQSSESKALVRDLRATTAEAKAFKPLMTGLANLLNQTYAESGGEVSEDNLECFCKTLTMECIFYYLRCLDLQDKKSPNLCKFMCQNLTQAQKTVFVTETTDDSGTTLKAKQHVVSDEVTAEYRQKQFDAVKNYLLNPDNNGKKLMQYMQVNSSGNLKENTLKTKSTLEIERLEKIGTLSSKNKATLVRAAMPKDGDRLNEKGLREALKKHRGFFKNMPDSYTNVFCKDNSLASHSQM
jgi:hypothetical protein